MAENTERLTAALEGRYRIESALGEGGMASVYLATDLKHDRKVALKVLKPELAAVLGGERFLQEIKVTANLQHPHVLPLHDSGTADGLVYYVMPYVEGESLRDRLDREKQLPVAEAVRIAVAVGSALDYAHRRDVVHRDIKPANILLLDGEPLVADFGIAIAVNAAGGTRLTDTGLSIGTPHYMSPEQAAGDRKLDGRSDVYALAAMTYEMLTGDPPFGGSTAQSVLAKILTEKAPLASQVREATPHHVALAIQKGLAKLPADRFDSAADFVEALQRPELAGGQTTPAGALAAGSAPGAASGGTSGALGRLGKIGWLAAGVAGLALGLLGGGLLSSDPEEPVLRVSINTDDHPDILGIGDALGRGAPGVVARDGSFIVFIGITEGGQSLFRRDLDAFEIRELAGTEGAFDLALTGDDSSLIFSRGAEKRIMPADGGLSRVLASPALFPVDASDDRYIYLTTVDQPLTRGHLARIPREGGDVEIIARADSGRFLFQPRLLPGERSALVSIGPFPDVNRPADEYTIMVVDIDSGETRALAPGAVPYFIEPDRIVFFQESGAVHARFDAGAGEIVGPVQPFYGDGLDAAAGLTVSRSGHLLTRDDLEAGGQLVWVGMDGSELGTVGPVGAIGSFEISPDGSQVAVAIEDDIWVHPSEPGAPPLRLTLGDMLSDHPTWTSDGRDILMRRGLGDDADLYRIAADGTGSPELVLDADVGVFRPSAGPGDTVVFYRISDETTGDRDVWATVDGWEDVRPVVATEAVERGAQISPDGRWLAYVSDVTGTDEVYVTSFPDAAGRWPISAGGGWEPVWSPDGSGIFFRTETEYRVARIETEAGFRVTSIRTLFPRGLYAGSPHIPLYDADPEGDRLLLRKGIQGATTLDLVLNWSRELATGASR